MMSKITVKSNPDGVVRDNSDAIMIKLNSSNLIKMFLL